MTVADALLKVHRSYLAAIQALVKAKILKGAAHITGGGISDNTPRMLPKGFGVEIDLQSWTVPPLFEHLRELGNIPEEDYRRTFNLGVGMILCVGAKHAAKAATILNAMKEPNFRMGSVIPVRRGARVRYV